MRLSTHRSVVVPMAILVSTVVLLVLAGCAVDRLKLSIDRGMISPKVNPVWIDTGSSTNVP